MVSSMDISKVVENYNRNKQIQEKKQEEKKKSLYSKFIVLLVILLNFWFTNRLLDIFLITMVEPVALIAAWFGFTTGELWLLASIRKKKHQ
jgi:hypothetical protein